DHRPATDAAGDVFERRGVGAARVQFLPYLSLLVLGLRQVLTKGRGELFVPGDARRPFQLGEGLDLDRVDVGQVLRQLLGDRAIAHLGLQEVECVDLSLPVSGPELSPPSSAGGYARASAAQA